ncbi:MAG: PAS domain-containing protein, partial [Syntrophales bacterium]
MEQNGFLKNLFESIPCGVLVMDSERRVQALNNVLKQAFGISKFEVIDKRGGEVIKCVHAFKSPRGCGFAEVCQTCRIRSTAQEAITGKHIHRVRADVQLLLKGQFRDIKLLLSAAPFEHDGERFAIV